MPTYQYACKECDHHFEAVQSFSDPSLTECPQCSGSLRKLYGSVGVIFKGSGFYRTDSRSDSKSSSANGSAKNGSTDTNGSAKPGSNGSAKSDSGSSSGSSSSSSSTAKTASAAS
ncbi:putative FmdB family regulatory protein [Prauserella shujinwangii]|uniref:Putative FmdB family regulatory protein n=1 Tax=Prauserella shujinwangii TaxID=1453103 RepID=A0A2T0M0E2_9PSEU|nr:FmdB family zinc ribbon protein [Prauserella shujinwangii]PRX50048.1 putative FmdB family regulatory protein [Prauserella shujinwangii]